MSTPTNYTFDMQGTVRRPITGGRRNPDTPLKLGVDWLGNQLASEVLPFKAIRAASGRRFNAVNGNGSTFLAPATAWPTTTVAMALWNGEPDGGLTYFIDQLYSFLASGTPAAGGALLAAVTLDRQTANPTAYANTVISGLSGKLGATSKARFVNNPTLVGGTPAWQVVAGEPAAPATASIASHVLQAEIQGGIAIPPGYMLCLTYLSGAGTTPLYGFGVTWDEIQADLE